MLLLSWLRRKWIKSGGICSRAAESTFLSWTLEARFFIVVFASREGSVAKAIQAIRQFVECEDGPTAVEYAVMLALIIVVCLLAIGNLGKAASKTFQSAASSLGAAS